MKQTQPGNHRVDQILTWSFSSRKPRMVPGMMPRTPPPSMLRRVTMLPYDGVGVRGVGSRRLDSGDSTAARLTVSDLRLFSLGHGMATGSV